MLPITFYLVGESKQTMEIFLLKQKVFLAKDMKILGEYYHLHHADVSHI